MYNCENLWEAAQNGNLIRLSELILAKASVDTKDDDMKTALHYAAEYGQSAAVQLLLDFCAALDSVSLNDRATSLHLATAEGHTAIVQVLLDAKANPDIQDIKCLAPLHYAVNSNKRALALVLLDAGASPDVKDKDGFTPLHYSAWEGYLTVTQALIGAKAALEIENGSGFTPLQVAIRKKSGAVVQTLIAAKASFHAFCDDEDRGLFDAVVNNDTAMLQTLLQSYTDVNAVDLATDATPLSLAIMNGQDAIVQMLLDAKANITIQDCKGPLHLAVENGKTGIVRLLLNAQVDVDTGRAQGNRDKTSVYGPLHHAARDGDIEMMRVLLDARADVNRHNSVYPTPLRMAADNNHTTAMQVLIQAGASLDIRDYDKTVLHRATEYGNLAAVQLLLDAKADVNGKASDPPADIGGLYARTAVSSQETALHYAARSGNPAIVRLLVNAQAALDAKGEDDKTPLHDAVICGHRETVQILLEAKASHGGEFGRDDTLLLTAAASGDTDEIMTLVAANANVNATKPVFGVTSLHCAAMNGHHAAVKLLLDLKSAVNSVDMHLRTPLDLAALADHASVMRVLIDAKAAVTMTPLPDTNIYPPPLPPTIYVPPRPVLPLDTDFDVPPLLSDDTRPANHDSNTAMTVLLDAGAARQRPADADRLFSSYMTGGDMIGPSRKCSDSDTSLLVKTTVRGLNAATRVLIDAKADVSEHTERLLYNVAADGNLAALNMLISAKADISTCPSVLFAAADAPSQVTVALINAKARVNVADEKILSLTPLHFAAEKGCIMAVQALIDAKADVNAMDEDDKTPLHYAAMSGGCETVQALIDADADVDADTIAPLHYAVVHGHAAVMQILIDADADIGPLAADDGHHYEELKEWDSDTEAWTYREKVWSYMHSAAALGHTAAIQVLVDAKASVNVESFEGETPLYYACMGGREHPRIALEELRPRRTDGSWIKKPVRFRIKDLDPPKSPLPHRYIAATRALLNAKATISAKEDSDTPLHLAIECGQTAVAKLLIDANANVNVRNADVDTPLHLAATQNNITVVQALVRAKADVDVKGRYQRTPLFFAARCHPKISHFLIDAKATVNAMDRVHETPLVQAIDCDNIAVVQVLVNAKAPVNVPVRADPRFLTSKPSLLLYAAQYRGGDVVQILIGANANVNVQGEAKRTPLHHAAKELDATTIQTLIDAKASIDPRDDKGLTPLVYAVSRCYRAAVQTLVDAKADVNIKTQSHTPLLLRAVARRYEVDSTVSTIFDPWSSSRHEPGRYKEFKAEPVAVIQTLIDANADVNAQDKSGQTPLHRAVEHNDGELVHMLVDANAAVDICDRNYKTPLHLAAECGYNNLLQFLIDAQQRPNN